MNSKTVTRYSVAMAIILSACAAPTPSHCPEGYTCTPYTPTPTLPGMFPESTHTITPPPPTATAITPQPTRMLESFAAFGIPIKFRARIWLDDNRYASVYREDGWSEDNSDCMIHPDGSMEASGETECALYPYPGLRVAGIFRNTVEEGMASALLYAYGGRVVNRDDSGEDIVVAYVFE